MSRPVSSSSRVTVQCANEAAHPEPMMLEKFKSQVDRNTTGRFFCSKACRDAVGAKPRTRDRRLCQNPACDRDFYPRTSAQRFCSRECADVIARTNQTERICPQCGEPFLRAASEPDQFCSRAHYDAYRATHATSYVHVSQPDHPKAWLNGRVAEHRLVMERVLGRELFEGETVHHKNGDRRDNRRRNLELWITAQPAGQRPEDLVVFASEILTRYATPEQVAALAESMRLT